MRKLSFMLAILVIFIFTSAMSMGQTSTPDPHLAGTSRLDLVIPDEVWQKVLGATGRTDGVIGFSQDTMSHFKGSKHILSTVAGLFRDIKRTPRLTGLTGDLLLASPSNFAEAAAQGFRFLDTFGGRHVEPPAVNSWGVAWIEDGTSTDDALVAAIGADAAKRFHKLPENVRLLITRTLVAMKEFTPVLNEAIDEDFLKSYFKVDNLDAINRDDLYNFSTGPWGTDDEDEYVILPRESFDAIDKFDLDFHVTGSKGFLTHLRAAVDEYQVSATAIEVSIEHFDVDTEFGKVGIFGLTHDKIEGNYALVIDLGGSDEYTGQTASPSTFSKPISVVIDLGGNDTYDGCDAKGALACGMYGVGVLLDLNGDDVYTCDESGIGRAIYGTGLVVDYAGNDTYTSNKWGQGAAQVGLGLLIDISGDDKYNCNSESEGFGGTLGVGGIIDAAGNDIYFADPEGAISELFEFRSTNLSQGFGYGRRADFGDGHSMGGGVGMLIDGAGDDSYTGSVYVQGAGYWWALGFLEDRGGNDTYANEQYSCGSAPHFAIGCAVDFSGDDKYNVGNDDMERQLQAHARDGSFGIFIDGSGNDQYQLDNMCGGSSDLNSLTLFWDRMGDDNYIADRRTVREDADSFGASTFYPPANTFRDETPTIGVFLDTGGTDKYDYILPEDATAAATLKPLNFGDSSEWYHDPGPIFWGYGLDVDWFEGFMPEEKASSEG